MKIKTLKAIAAGIGVCFGLIPDCNGAVCKNKLTYKAEIPIIRIAAERNGIAYGSDDWYILLAIRFAENGCDGLQFGIMNPKAYNLDLQAAWCAATIVKNRARWAESDKSKTFIEFLANRYCPAECDKEGNHNWKHNVGYWFERLHREKT